MNVLKSFFSKPTNKKPLLINEKAYNSYLQRNILGEFWIPIHPNLEISLNLLPDVDNRFFEKRSKLLIRNRGNLLEEIKLIIETEAGLPFLPNATKCQEIWAYKTERGEITIKCFDDLPSIIFWSLENDRDEFFCRELSITLSSIKNKETNTLQKINTSTKIYYACG